MEERRKGIRKLFEPQRNYFIENFWNLVDHDAERHYEYWYGHI